MNISASNTALQNQLHQNIETLFSKPGQLATAGLKLGNNLQQAENAYLNAVSKANASPGEVAKHEILYKRMMQVYQSFMQVTAAIFDILRQAISRLSMR